MMLFRLVHVPTVVLKKISMLVPGRNRRVEQKVI